MPEVTCTTLKMTRSPHLHNDGEHKVTRDAGRLPNKEETLFETSIAQSLQLQIQKYNDGPPPSPRVYKYTQIQRWNKNRPPLKRQKNLNRHLLSALPVQVVVEEVLSKTVLRGGRS